MWIFDEETNKTCFIGRMSDGTYKQFDSEAEYKDALASENE